MNNNESEEKDLEKDDSLAKKLLETRTIIISSSVDSKLADQVIKQLLMLEAMDAEAEIKVLINSPGGEIQSGFAIYDMMHFISCPITTIVAGLAASMGSVLMLAADKGRRFVFPHAKVMIHQPSLSGAQGSSTDLEIHAHQILKTREFMSELYAEKTGKAAAEIMKDMERDYWMTAQESLDYGLFDRIITSREDIS
ncbi:MAG: ATP-dependent Clp protease proteolytic subunit [SAR324 cluster bacterium]|uniref:ATP-dependent Clp protease proteolytic subunit n=1 Tax=SAR324 cluster bacterium TaxID=2024889 RepID=A0A2A4T7A4_9DELT|nr:MAG: ATP-dependent Clp protease proteolytic subunit [SAR324 cluster bacterium]